MDREENLNRLSDCKIPHKDHPWYIHHKYYLEDMFSLFSRYIEKHDSVLDIGCGNKPFESFILNLTEQGRYIGCDIVQSSEKKVNILCDVTNIPLDDESFDVIICTQVIEHVFDHSKVFQEANRLLKKEGVFIVSSNFVWPMHEVPYDYYRFTKYGFEELLGKNGFSVKESCANGGKWAVLGQLIILIGGINYVSTNNWFKRKFKMLLRMIVNQCFIYLDNKYRSESDFTLNYIFVGKKVV